MLWKIAKAGYEAAIDYAAQELRRCLNIMDDSAEIAILQYPDYDPELTNMLWLSVCPQLSGNDPVLDDGYAIDVDHGCGSICGANPRSVLMGVYRLLKELGCAWVRPGKDGEIIPQRSTEGFKLHLTQSPSYRHRGICIEGAVNYQHVSDMIDWMPKLGLNAYFNQFQTPVDFYNRWYAHQRNPLLEGHPLTTRQIEGLRDQSIAELKKRDLLYHDAGHGWTCEPFGIPGETWDAQDCEVPAASVKYLAKVNGKRGLWHGVPLNTNLCYSNPTVRRKIADAVVRRCRAFPQIDYLHIWLADGVNNHCECDNCRKMRPSDWYVTLLNEIDEKLTRQKISTRIVFLMYVDLLWQPEQVTLRNTDRFVLMFAPITRTYSSSIADAPEFDDAQLPPYERNRLRFPRAVEENLAWLRRWQAQFPGDGFDYDYHFGRDHYSDPSYYDIARTVFRDMQALHSIGLNGMMSCQAQRVFFPTGLGMVSMAAALWDEHADFDQTAHSYFRDAFGPDGEMVHEYLRSLSESFDPVYLRCEKETVNPESAAHLSQVSDIVDAFADTISRHAEDSALHPGIRASWQYLQKHGPYCKLYARAFCLKAQGRFDDAKTALEDLFSYARQNEPELNHVFDAFKFQATVQGRLLHGMDK